MRDHGVALAGDDGLGVIVAVALARGHKLLDPLDGRLRQGELRQNLGVALEQLNRVVAALANLDRRGNLRLNPLENALDRGVEGMSACGGLRRPASRRDGLAGGGDELVHPPCS